MYIFITFQTHKVKNVYSTSYVPEEKVALFTHKCYSFYVFFFFRQDIAKYNICFELQRKSKSRNNLITSEHYTLNLYIISNFVGICDSKMKDRNFRNFISVHISRHAVDICVRFYLYEYYLVTILDKVTKTTGVLVTSDEYRKPHASTCMDPLVINV